MEDVSSKRAGIAAIVMAWVFCGVLSIEVIREYGNGRPITVIDGIGMIVGGPVTLGLTVALTGACMVDCD